MDACRPLQIELMSKSDGSKAVGYTYTNHVSLARIRSLGLADCSRSGVLDLRLEATCARMMSRYHLRGKLRKSLQRQRHLPLAYRCNRDTQHS